MGLLDRILGGGAPRAPEPAPALSADEQAIARYRYLLKTAPPETIEDAHAEAFSCLTPEQRRQVLEQLGAQLSDAERAAAARSGDDPRGLARTATRAEVRVPGTLERVFGGVAPAGAAAPVFGSGMGGGGMGGGVGMGGLLAGGFLSSMAGTVLGSVIAQHFFHADPDAAHLFGGDGTGGHALADAGPANDPFHTSDGLGGDAAAGTAGSDPAGDGGDGSFDRDGGGFDGGNFDTGGDSFDGGGDSFDV